MGFHKFSCVFFTTNHIKFFDIAVIRISLFFTVCMFQIHADPSDINILPEYNKDPRVVKNLADGNNRTRDDVHMWLAPFNVGSDHMVYCTFDKPCKVALVRIWVSFRRDFNLVNKKDDFKLNLPCRLFFFIILFPLFSQNCLV